MYHGKRKNEIEDQMKNDLTKYLAWLAGNELVTNSIKTNYMIFKPQIKPEINLNLKINSVIIQRTTSTKYLGVILDDKLNWREHIDSIKRKVNSLVGALKRCPSFNKQVATLVYNGHILSKIRPNILIWGQCTETLYNEVQRLMNRALKILFKFDWLTPSASLPGLTNTFNLKEITKLERCKFIYKISKKEIKANITLTRHENQHPHFTRNRRNFVRIESETDRMFKDIVNVSQDEFNKLPNTTKEVHNLGLFTKLVKRRIIANR